VEVEENTMSLSRNSINQGIYKYTDTYKEALSLSGWSLYQQVLSKVGETSSASG
jgi:hypothetical protein